MTAVNVTPFEIETRSRHGNLVRAERSSRAPVYELHIELLPMSFLVRAGEMMRLEISNWESTITEALMTLWYGQKVGTDTYYHHNTRFPSCLRLHKRPQTAAAGNEKAGDS